MPKRTTLTFTSEDAPRQDNVKLWVYHCKYSGRHAFTVGESPVMLHTLIALSMWAEHTQISHCKSHVPTVDVDLRKLPRRRTDGAYIVDTETYTLQLYTVDGGVKLIKR